MLSHTTYRLFCQLRSAAVALVVAGVIIGTFQPQTARAAELLRVAFSKFVFNNCPASGSCSVDFGTVPGGGKRRYEITSVTCYLIIANINGRPLYWYLYALRNGQQVGRIHLRPTFMGTTPTERTYHATEQGLVVVQGGGTIGVTMTRDTSTAGGINGLQCSIGGYDVRLE
jgi:hypothetical protein